MGLAPSELENLTPYQFNLMREGYVEHMKGLWEIGRFQAYIVYRMNTSDDPVSIEEFLPLNQSDLKEEKPAKVDMANLPAEAKDFLHKLANPDLY